MSAWLTLLAGLVVWLIHFAIVYALPSLDAIGAAPARTLAVLNAGATLACLATVIALAIGAWKKTHRDAPGEVFRQRIAALGAAIASVAIVWQAAPALIG